MAGALNIKALFLSPLQKEKAVNDKKEDKKTKKAKENVEAEANEENHSENGEAKTNEVGASFGAAACLVGSPQTF